MKNNCLPPLFTFRAGFLFQKQQVAIKSLQILSTFFGYQSADVAVTKPKNITWKEPHFNFEQTKKIVCFVKKYRILYFRKLKIFSLRVKLL